MKVLVGNTEAEETPPLSNEADVQAVVDEAVGDLNAPLEGEVMAPADKFERELAANVAAIENLPKNDDVGETRAHEFEIPEPFSAPYGYHRYNPSDGRPIPKLYGWQNVISRGHILGHRYSAVCEWGRSRSPIFSFLAVLVFVVAAAASILNVVASGHLPGVTLSSLGVPPKIAEVLKPAIQTPAAVRVAEPESSPSFNLSWLASAVPSGLGISQEAWTATVAAVRSDIARSGLKPDAWRGVASLPGGGPLVTKPSRLLRGWTDASGPHQPLLPEIGNKGVVLMPEQAGDPVSVIAAVAGSQPAWVLIFQGGCSIVSGPAITGCQRGAAGFLSYVNRLSPS